MAGIVGGLEGASGASLDDMDDLAPSRGLSASEGEEAENLADRGTTVALDKSGGDGDGDLEIEVAYPVDEDGVGELVVDTVEALAEDVEPSDAMRFDEASGGDLDCDRDDDGVVCDNKIGGELWTTCICCCWENLLACLGDGVDAAVMVAVDWECECCWVRVRGAVCEGVVGVGV